MKGLALNEARIAGEKTQQFFSLVESCHLASTKNDFLLRVYPKLWKLIPHEMFACGIINLPDVMVQDQMINVSFPENYLRRIVSPRGEILSPALRRWAETKEVQYLDGRSIETATMVEPSWRSTFLDYGLSNVAGHGLADICSKAASYFGFAGLRAWSAQTAFLMETTVPHLHIALTKIFKRQSALQRGSLSGRQHEILRWICMGKSNHEIGLILGISPWTAKNHVTNILGKLQATTRSHAVARAIQMGIVSLD